MPKIGERGAAPGGRHAAADGARAQSRNQIVVFLNFIDVARSCWRSLAAASSLYVGKREFEAPGPGDQRPARSWSSRTPASHEIADQLERRGLISDARIFRIGVRAYGNDGQLKAGEYEIKAGASMHDIMELLKSGKSVCIR